jgi:probable HAF family extracellular repeat protein
LLSGWPGAFAFGLNNNKQVFGAANNVDSAGNIVETPVLWNQGSPIDLGIPAGYSSATANGINDRGQVVGNAFSFDRETPFVWYKGQMKALPLLPGAVSGAVNGINDRGEIVGSVNFGSSPPPGTGEFHSVLWTPKGQDYLVLDLGGFEGYFVSSAGHINNGGKVVGFSDSASSAGNIHAYLWTGGPLQDLGTLPGGTFSFTIWNNQRAQIIGGGDRADRNVVDFVWQNGIMTDLNDLVPAGTPLLGGLGPGGINERGAIAETALLPDGSAVAFLLTPVR